MANPVLRRWFVLGAHTVLHVIKFALALEMGWRVFRGFPGARAAARQTALSILGLTAVVTLTFPIDPSADIWTTEIAHLQPRVITSVMWLMAVTLVLAQWYRIPTHPFQYAVLSSFVPYLAVESIVLTIVGNGWLEQRYANIDPCAYLILACWWVYVAWRPDRTATVSTQIVRSLQLRGTTCG